MFSTSVHLFCFHAMMPSGITLKSVAELMVRCSQQTSTTVDDTGITFVACDPTSGRLIRVHIHPADMQHFRFMGQTQLKCTLESPSLHAVFHQLKRRDQVVLYGTHDGQFGSLVDYSGPGLGIREISPILLGATGSHQTQHHLRQTHRPVHRIRDPDRVQVRGCDRAKLHTPARIGHPWLNPDTSASFANTKTSANALSSPGTPPTS